MIKKIAFIIWCITSFTILFFWIGHAGETDIQIAMGYPLIAINFPISLGVAWTWGSFIISINKHFGLFIPPGLPQILADWGVFTSAGFVQWYLIVPWIVKRIKKDRDE